MKLEKFIEQNHGLFISEEPGQGHIERFSAKMDAYRFPGKHERTMNFLKIAALVVFIFLSTAVFFKEFGLFQAGDIYVVNPGDSELEDAERYYSGLLDNYYNVISHLSFSNNEHEKKTVLSELQEMDRQVVLMRNDLRQDPGNEIIINAIINHYRIQLELMDNIITQVGKSDNSIL
jgi:hypothetical protein